MKQATGKNKLENKDGKKFVFVQLIDGSTMQIQQLINILNKQKTDEFEFIVTNQYVEWNTIDNIINSLSLARDKDLKRIEDFNKKIKGETKND